MSGVTEMKMKTIDVVLLLVMGFCAGASAMILLYAGGILPGS